jgi:hypothetical protein
MKNPPTSVEKKYQLETLINKGKFTNLDGQFWENPDIFSMI